MKKGGEDGRKQLTFVRAIENRSRLKVPAPTTRDRRRGKRSICQRNPWEKPLSRQRETETLIFEERARERERNNTNTERKRDGERTRDREIEIAKFVCISTMTYRGTLVDAPGKRAPRQGSRSRRAREREREGLCVCFVGILFITRRGDGFERTTKRRSRVPLKVKHGVASYDPAPFNMMLNTTTKHIQHPSIRFVYNILLL